MSGTPCEQCSYYVYNEFLECYECTVNMDEDEYQRIEYYAQKGCPYYHPGDEYTIVRKQN